MTGKLSTLTGLGALGHLYLQVRAIDQIVGGNTEASRRHLLDGAAAVITVLVRRVAAVVFTTLSGIAARAHAVHGDGHRLVGFPADRPEGRRAGGKPLYDFGRSLHLFNGNGLVIPLEVQQPAQGCHTAALVVGEPGEFPVYVVVVAAGSVLKNADAVRVPLMMLAAPPPLVRSPHGQ